MMTKWRCFAAVMGGCRVSVFRIDRLLNWSKMGFLGVGTAMMHHSGGCGRASGTSFSVST